MIKYSKQGWCVCVSVCMDNVVSLRIALFFLNRFPQYLVCGVRIIPYISRAIDTYQSILLILT